MTAGIAFRFALLCAFCLATNSARAALAPLIYQPDPVVDPGCHCFNDGISFAMNLTPVPEVTPVVPAVCLIISVTMLEVRRRRRAARRKTA